MARKETWTYAVLIISSLLALHGSAESPFKKTSYGRTFVGNGTYYGFTPAGNCAMREKLPSIYRDMLPVAMNHDQYDFSRSCGACLRIISSGAGAGRDPIIAPRLAYVHDRCPECLPGDLDLSESGDGLWKIKWEFIPCPGRNEELQVFFEGSNAYYWKLQVRGTRSPLRSFVAEGINGNRTQDNFFEFHGKRPEASDIVANTVLGETVRFRLPRWVEDGVVNIGDAESETTMPQEISAPQVPPSPLSSPVRPSMIPTSTPAPASVTPTSTPSPSPSMHMEQFPAPPPPTAEETSSSPLPSLSPTPSRSQRPEPTPQSRTRSKTPSPTPTASRSMPPVENGDESQMPAQEPIVSPSKRTPMQSREPSSSPTRSSQRKRVGSQCRPTRGKYGECERDLDDDMKPAVCMCHIARRCRRRYHGRSGWYCRAQMVCVWEAC